jgi:hypothetical protein
MDFPSSTALLRSGLTTSRSIRALCSGEWPWFATGLNSAPTIDRTLRTAPRRRRCMCTCFRARPFCGMLRAPRACSGRAAGARLAFASSSSVPSRAARAPRRQPHRLEIQTELSSVRTTKARFANSAFSAGCSRTAPRVCANSGHHASLGGISPSAWRYRP